MLISLSSGLNFMWWRRLPRNIFLILEKLRIARILLCNQFMVRRKRIESAGGAKKETCLLFHQGNN